MLDDMLDELLSRVDKYNPDADFDMIEKAFYFSEEAHRQQVRNSGEPYFIHPYHVALILCDLNMDTATIVAGLLHDSIEDTDVTYEDIKEEFSEEIANLVDGVTKLKKLPYKTKQENQAENLRKMVLAMSKDVRVIIVKLADRLHNMRTLEYMSPAKKKEKALETLEIYAPLAHRMGISKIKWELEDLSLRYLNPEEYYDLVEKVSKKRAEREEYINSISEILGQSLDEQNIKYEISGRPKSFYSIYKKMKDKNKTFDQIFDLTAMRILVDDVKSCYEVLGIVHNLWKPIPGRFKDYIAMPKPNMYQSIHTTVIGEKGEIFEVQIRTWDMHRTAEYGIAAHWRYKEGKDNKGDSIDSKLAWLRQLLEWQGDMDDPKDFMETLKVDFFTDEVYVFTPRGDVISLPDGSTPIDFAYRVHTEVGNRCVGAKVDGRIVPLNYKLKTGNIVDIITSDNSGPSRDWVNIVKSPQARTKIRQWFKVKEKDINIERGRDSLEREVRKLNYDIDKFLEEDRLLKIANRMGFATLDDMYASLGFGSTSLGQIIPKLRDGYNERYVKHEEEARLEEASKKTDHKKDSKKKQASKNKSSSFQGVSIADVDNIKVRFSKCCNPLPGDDIIGYITRGRGISIHRKDCANMIAVDDPERLIEVGWDQNKEASYSAEIQIQSVDRSGLLSEVTRNAEENDLTILSLNARANRDNIVTIIMMAEVKDTKHLNKFINNMRKVEGIIDAYRVTV